MKVPLRVGRSTRRLAIEHQWTQYKIWQVNDEYFEWRRQYDSAWLYPMVKLILEQQLDEWYQEICSQQEMWYTMDLIGHWYYRQHQHKNLVDHFEQLLETSWEWFDRYLQVIDEMTSTKYETNQQTSAWILKIALQHSNGSWCHHFCDRFSCTAHLYNDKFSNILSHINTNTS